MSDPYEAQILALIALQAAEHTTERALAITQLRQAQAQWISVEVEAHNAKVLSEACHHDWIPQNNGTDQCRLCNQCRWSMKTDLTLNQYLEGFVKMGGDPSKLDFSGSVLHSDHDGLKTAPFTFDEGGGSGGSSPLKLSPFWTDLEGDDAIDSKHDTKKSSGNTIAGLVSDYWNIWTGQKSSSKPPQPTPAPTQVVTPAAKSQQITVGSKKRRLRLE